MRIKVKTGEREKQKGGKKGRGGGGRKKTVISATTARTIIIIIIMREGQRAEDTVNRCKCPKAVFFFFSHKAKKEEACGVVEHEGEKRSEREREH